MSDAISIISMLANMKMTFEVTAMLKRKVHMQGETKGRPWAFYSAEIDAVGSAPRLSIDADLYADLVEGRLYKFSGIVVSDSRGQHFEVQQSVDLLREDQLKRDFDDAGKSSAAPAKKSA